MENFDGFIAKLSHQINQELPGREAQFKMVPKNSFVREKYISTPSEARLSAVLCLFYPVGNIPHFILMERNTYNGVHSGQISLPGGKVEKGETPEQAALRETNEEIGVMKNSVKLIKELTAVYIPPSNYLVKPFMGFSLTKPDFIPDHKEVQQLIEVEVAQLLDERVLDRKMVHLKITGTEIEYPCFNFSGKVVWGATGMILSEIKEIVKKIR